MCMYAFIYSYMNVLTYIYTCSNAFMQEFIRCIYLCMLMFTTCLNLYVRYVYVCM